MSLQKQKTDMYIRKTQCEHEGGHLQAKERGLKQILPSETSGRTSPANILISDFRPIELSDNKFLLFKPPGF
jgi:hypothetical protein